MRHERLRVLTYTHPNLPDSNFTCATTFYNNAIFTRDMSLTQCVVLVKARTDAMKLILIILRNVHMPRRTKVVGTILPIKAPRTILSMSSEFAMRCSLFVSLEYRVVQDKRL
jgi:hypothetical protein